MKKSIVENRINIKGYENLLSDSHRYETDNGIISLLHPCGASQNLYEIYCIKGDLFEDVEQFDTLEEAEERITELLNPTP